MNDEQQFWRDVQKFMNQFPGFVSVAKKIGEIGDLETWQASEQRKLEAITQEIEKQRAVIVSEREAANAAAARLLLESEAKLLAHAEQINQDSNAAKAANSLIMANARNVAEMTVASAQAKAKEITDVTEPRKAALEAEITALMDKMLAVKGEHEVTQNALAQAKGEHASFLKKLLGTADA